MTNTNQTNVSRHLQKHQLQKEEKLNQKKKRKDEKKIIMKEAMKTKHENKQDIVVTCKDKKSPAGCEEKQIDSRVKMFEEKKRDSQVTQGEEKKGYWNQSV